MNTLDQLRLNGIKNKLTRHQPLAPDDLQWLISKIENIDFELQSVMQKYQQLKDAINRSQMLALDANDRVHKVCGNDK